MTGVTHQTSLFSVLYDTVLLQWMAHILDTKTHSPDTKTHMLFL